MNITKEKIREWIKNNEQQVSDLGFLYNNDSQITDLLHLALQDLSPKWVAFDMLGGKPTAIITSNKSEKPEKVYPDGSIDEYGDSRDHWMPLPEPQK